MTKISLIKVLGLLLGLLLVASACGDSSGSSIGSPGGGGGLGGRGDDFCDLSRELDEADPFGDELNFNEDFFDEVDDILGRLISTAPSEIRGDMEVTRDGIRDFVEILEEYDFNIFDPELGAAMEDLDSDELDAAGDRITEFLESECGITDDDSDSGDGAFGDPGDDASFEELFGDLEGLDDESSLTQAMMVLLGVDEETAKCLSEELGEFDTDDPDPELLTKEVCGTTLLEIMTGVGG